MESLQLKNENTKANKTTQDECILESIKVIVPSISLVFGPNCMVALYSTKEPSYPCIAIENGDIADIKLGSTASGFMSDIISEESSPDGKDVVGLYYTKTYDGRALKSIISMIRNKKRELIGCLYIGIDLSVPLHDFIQHFIPVVDNNLANSLAEIKARELPSDINDILTQTLERVVASVNNMQISPTEKNRLIVKELQQRGVFDIRGAVEIVANRLGVSRYTIYNYLKDTSVNEEDLN